MAVPQKIQHGLNFKKAVLGTLNALIDYLNSNWLQGGPGVNIRRTPSGTIIEIAKPKTAAPQSSGGGSGSAQDLSVSVSGNTAFIGLSGSTATAELVGTGDVSISGNTNGQIEINATGGGGGGGSFNGFPDFANGTPISGGTSYSFPMNGWLIGYVSNYSASNATGNCDCLLSIDGDGFTSILIHLLETHDLIIPGTLSDYVPLLSNPVSIPIPAGTTFNINPNVYVSNPAILNLSYYPCITAPPVNRTVTTPSGTGNGSLFRALSDDGDANISFEQSLDGQPIDFEGASVL